jgi:hypothetical protein
MSSDGEIQRRLAAAVEKLQSNLSRTHFRPMMKQVHACSIGCYDNPNLNDEQLQICEQNCASQVQTYKHVFENEMNSFQNRLQRGIMECQDDAQDKVTDSVRADSRKLEAVQLDMMKCVSACVDKHIAMLPGLQKKIEGEFNSFPKR